MLPLSGMLKQFKGSLLIVFSALCFGSYGVFAKYLAGSSFTKHMSVVSL